MTPSPSDDDPTTWPERVAARFGRNLKIARTERDEPMTAGVLAIRCQALGGNLTRSRIANLETGRREVAVADLLVLAAALGVSPAWLLAPAGGYGDDTTEVLPNTGIPTATAYGWLTGRVQGPPVPETPWDEYTATWTRTTERADLAVQHDSLVHAWKTWDEDGGPPPDLTELREVRRRMRVAGAPVPELPGHLSARLVDGGRF